jgi:hypothetical protein
MGGVGTARTPVKTGEETTEGDRTQERERLLERAGKRRGLIPSSVNGDLRGSSGDSGGKGKGGKKQASIISA